MALAMHSLCLRARVLPLLASSLKSSACSGLLLVRLAGLSMVFGMILSKPISQLSGQGLGAKVQTGRTQLAKGRRMREKSLFHPVSWCLVQYLVLSRDWKISYSSQQTAPLRCLLGSTGPTESTLRLS